MGSFRFWFPATAEIKKAKHTAETKNLDRFRRRVNILEQCAHWFILVGVAGAVLIIVSIAIQPWFALPSIPEIPSPLDLSPFIAIPVLTLLGFFMLNRVARARREMDSPEDVERISAELRWIEGSLDRVIQLTKARKPDKDDEALVSRLEHLQREIERARREFGKHHQDLQTTLSQVVEILAEFEKVRPG